ncbi:MAG: saccharopine dehydrogenase NADP-binding domain-containing protein, partial [Thaumarchaeota archaeon]|nr:saccharopine dehydrogenase NADP-binding domain-containing protein [Nitrososphaerota archaeon]
MKAAVLGSGLMGSVISWDLSRSADVDEVVVADLDPARLKALKRRAGKKLGTEVVDVKKAADLARFLKGFDVVASALPHGAVHPADVVAVKNGVKMVNIAFEDEQMELDAAARKSGATLIPGCGLAPGLGGILLAHGAEMIGGATSGRILVGGLPQKPVPPFGYKLVFSVIGLLREYMDDARVIRDGKVVTVRP